jgi:hypothetical protein
LVHEGLYIVNVVEDVVPFVHLDGEEQDVGQVFGLVDVASRPPRFYRFFVSFYMCQLFVHQTCGNDGKGF